MADADLFAAYQEAVADRDAAGQAWADNTDPALSDDLLDAWLSASQLVDSRLSDLVNDIQPIDDSVGSTDLGTESPLIATVPIKLTSSMGNSKPRMAIDSLDNIWMVWHSDRSGSDEVYVARYFGQCGVWSTSGQGGEELKVTNFGPEGRRAMNPNVAVGPDGQVHIAFQGQTEDGRWEIYYCHSTAGGSRFTVPIRITNSPGNALMPDIAVFVTSGQGAEGSATVVVIVWHDDRFGPFEIMSAQRVNGEWASSGQGRSDTRITQADGDSMFPRVESDTKGNVRVVYQDSRRGESNVGIYMSTFVGTSGTWDSSASGGSDRLVSNGPSGSFNPDIDIDKTGGISVAWHDLRNAQEDPEQHEEIYALYCPRLGHPSGAHYPPLQPNIEARLDADFEIVDGVGFKPIVATNSPEIYLSINAPNATFWRASNEDGQYSAWQEFRPNFDLETMLVPWTLNCVSGKKQVCVQVQDAEMVGFPICHDIDLALQPPDFQVEFFEDADLTIPLARTPLDRPAARRGDVYIKLSTEVSQILPPTFEVVSRGQRLILNQETEPLDEGSSATVGIGSFVGGTVDISQEDNVSPAALAFSAAAGRTFRGRFSLKCHDGLLNVDGPARVIVKPMDVCGKISAGQQDLAEGLSVVGPPDSNVVLPDLEGGNPSNELRQFPVVPITDPNPDLPDDSTLCTSESWLTGPNKTESEFGTCGSEGGQYDDCYAAVQEFYTDKELTLRSCSIKIRAGLVPPPALVPEISEQQYPGQVIVEIGHVEMFAPVTTYAYITAVLQSRNVSIGSDGNTWQTVTFFPSVRLVPGRYCILIRSMAGDSAQFSWTLGRHHAAGSSGITHGDRTYVHRYNDLGRTIANTTLPMKLWPYYATNQGFRYALKLTVEAPCQDPATPPPPPPVEITPSCVPESFTMINPVPPNGSQVWLPTGDRTQRFSIVRYDSKANTNRIYLKSLSFKALDRPGAPFYYEGLSVWIRWYGIADNLDESYPDPVEFPNPEKGPVITAVPYNTVLKSPPIPKWDDYASVPDIAQIPYVKIERPGSYLCSLRPNRVNSFSVQFFADGGPMGTPSTGRYMLLGSNSIGQGFHGAYFNVNNDSNPSAWIHTIMEFETICGAPE